MTLGLDDEPTRVLLAEERRRTPDSLWPSIVTVHLTDRCNHRCSWCWFKRQDRVLDIGLAIAAVKVLLSQGAREIVVSGGGEPLLHPSIDTFLEFLTRVEGVQRSLYTNGSTLEAHPLVEQAFDYVRVSVDAGGARRYAIAHGTTTETYDRVLQSVAALASRLSIGVSMVVREGDRRSVERLIDDCEKHSIPRLFLKPVMTGSAREGIPHFVRSLRSRRVAITVREGPGTATGHPTEPLPPSMAAMDVVLVADSKIYPCCHVDGADWVIMALGEDPREAIGSPRHREILRRYAGFPHACRTHDAWNRLSNTLGLPSAASFSGDPEPRG